MKAIVCIDDNNGMMFNHRRQSRDAVVLEYILKDTKNSTLWMNNNSASLFAEKIKSCETLPLKMDIHNTGIRSEEQYSLETVYKCDENTICVDDDFIEKAMAEDFIFAENISIKNVEEQLEEIIIYYWNRKYPADFYLDIDTKHSSWELTDCVEFSGSSHEKIRKETYRRRHT